MFKKIFTEGLSSIIDNDDVLRDLYGRRKILKSRMKSLTEKINKTIKSKDILIKKRDSIKDGKQKTALTFKIKDMQSDIELMSKQLNDDEIEHEDIELRLKSMRK